ncbi:hypothetical protein GE107_20495 [Cohnella sp. CFH 77786]|uniref:hypothetical protein n=1 Tax=Cohnella sp. CFH 77786 TaxID=2662265 RepID=UPI001C60D105|nr:hypothetical protein [Cohnella sp. CFH 77786]MBW5448428.1 hypothetical protein [Cohnella sp. CFH 77786]
MKTSRYRTIVLFGKLMWVLGACTASSPTATTTLAETSVSEHHSPSPTTSIVAAEAVDFWNGEFPEGIQPADVFEQQSKSYTKEQLAAGLQNERAVVRWFCAYKLSELPEQANSDDDQLNQNLSRTDRANVETLRQMAETDPDEQVRNAAKFAASVLAKTYEGDGFVRSPDGKSIAYHLFREARFNNGKVWLVRDGKSTLLYKSDPSVTQLLFSPDGKRLAVGFGGRLWNSLAILDLERVPEEADRPALIDAILKNPKNGYADIHPEEIARFDPYVTIKSWSPDSRKFLFAYQFGDKDFDTHFGCGVYDVEAREITIVYPMETDGRAADPKGFHW